MAGRWSRSPAEGRRDSSSARVCTVRTGLVKRLLVMAQGPRKAGPTPSFVPQVERSLLFMCVNRAVD